MLVVAIHHLVPDAICGCGTIVQYIGECPPVNGNSKEGGVYAVSIPKFIITDDLQVAPACTRVMFSLIEKYGIPEKENIQEKVLQLNCAKVCLSLSLPVNMTPLNNFFTRKLLNTLIVDVNK